MKRSKHSLSHYKLATFNMGELIPLTWFETLPGDTIQQATASLIRLSPMLAPVMHPCQVRIHHWFVPLRLIWEDFEEFITGGPDGTSTFTPPRVYTSGGGTGEGSLWDYLGVPPGTASTSVSMLPVRAYQLIWNEHYRDQDLQSEAGFDTASGTDSTTATTIQNVCWEKDYFTTSRPWEQKGDDVYIPLYDETVPVQSDGTAPWFNDGGSRDVNMTITGASNSLNWSNTSAGATGNAIMGKAADVEATGLEIDLTATTGIPIEDLRLALGIQRYQEARARYGSRYSEYLAYLGVKSSDSRLQRPEYLGGGRQSLQFSEVLSTNDDDSSDYAGRLRGHGISAMKTNRYRKFFEEHGIVMTLASIVPKAIYTQGLHRKWFRETKEDYFQKELQFIGEQEVYNKEIYTVHSSPGDVFGYQARYDEYRSNPSGIAGEFHSTNDHWHMARIFSSDPSLNASFVACSPTKRFLASAGTDSIYCMANHSIQARRMIDRIAKTKI